METEQVASEDEPPSMLWGLDPVFSAFARLYIKDILLMRESHQVPGIYFYKTHPIFQVDILGIVVFKREREDFYSYGVDDGTGVINCLCWKSDKWKEQDEQPKGGRVASSSSVAGPSGGFNIEEQLRRLQEAQREISALDIGDLLRVRGSVKTSRGQREIMSSTFYKVSDPVMAVQISWMQELPVLYRRCYHKPFNPASGEPGTSSTTAAGQPSFSPLLGRATQTLRDFLREKEVRRFRPYDVEHLLHPLVAQLPLHTEGEQSEMQQASTVLLLRKHTNHIFSCYHILTYTLNLCNYLLTKVAFHCAPHSSVPMVNLVTCKICTMLFSLRENEKLCNHIFYKIWHIDTQGPLDRMKSICACVCVCVCVCVRVRAHWCLYTVLAVLALSKRKGTCWLGLSLKLQSIQSTHHLETTLEKVQI
ncbi:hypothetical protein ACEWY4_017802 [Coilia grayii]|uniref:CST complex subunit STN1 n=1 Tax=Coilia grayii TaxID=363190 RepID=A0ABD1JHX1_9TELE